MKFESLPEEVGLTSESPELVRFEDQLSRWTMRVGIPLLAIGLFFVDDVVGYLVTLDPVRLLRPTIGVDWRAVCVSAGVVILLTMWRVGVLKRGRLARNSMMSSAFAFGISLSVVIAAGSAWQLGYVRWLFLEAAKVRLEQLSFARSVAVWRSNDLQQMVTSPGESLWFVGSSQMNFGVDAERLQAAFPQKVVRKRALPGFGVMQYPMMLGLIERDHPEAVVCLLSEFDFFREDSLPMNRLRFFSNWTATRILAESLGVAESWRNRDGLADLAFAAICPIWRDRDLVRSVALGFWVPAGRTGREARQIAERTVGDELARGRANLAREIRRTRLVEANFEAFERFAHECAREQLRLIVVEGMTNPLATDVYPGEYRIETRRRLREMARRTGFEYLDESQRPTFVATDFIDAYHLGAGARERLTTYIAERLATPVPMESAR